jgi:hypothetical protein
MLQLNMDHPLDGGGPDGDPTLPLVFQALTDAGYAVQIAGTQHMTFSDLALLTDKFVGPFDPGTIGTIDPVRALAIMNAYTLAFFERYLKGKAEPLLDGPSPYPEVTFINR